jgi:hypothetical protein
MRPLRLVLLCERPVKRYFGRVLKNCVNVTYGRARPACQIQTVRVMPIHPKHYALRDSRDKIKERGQLEQRRHKRRMHAELLDEIPAAAVTPHADSTCSDEPMDRIQQLSSLTREIARLLKLVSLTKRRPTLPALQVTSSPSTARPSFEMPPPVIFSRKNKANAGPRRCKN